MDKIDGQIGRDFLNKSINMVKSRLKLVTLCKFEKLRRHFNLFEDFLNFCPILSNKLLGKFSEKINVKNGQKNDKTCFIIIFGNSQGHFETI